MSLTQKTAPTATERAIIVHKMLVIPALARSATEFEHYMGWCIHKLSIHGSTSQSPEVATTVFVRALWSASSAAQWACFRPIAEKNCSSEQWSKMVETHHVGQPVGDENLGYVIAAVETIEQALPAVDRQPSADHSSVILKRPSVDADTSPTTNPHTPSVAAGTGTSTACCIIM
jgi:hypothetical protein